MAAGPQPGGQHLHSADQQPGGSVCSKARHAHAWALARAVVFQPCCSASTATVARAFITPAGRSSSSSSY